jgi:methylphosphotriester-DNA--protein-cysteine methyltransferase
MILHEEIQQKELYQKIHHQVIAVAGNRRLKVYGTLHCKSGKKMKPGNRVFFTSEAEALNMGYRPCGHCLKKEYKIWKNSVTS